MRNRHWTFAFAAGALLAPALASAQLFKCKGPDGKVVYSDTRCEAAATGALKVTPMATTPSEREKAEAARAEAAKTEADKAKTASPALPPGYVIAPGGAAPGPYELTSSDQDRLRNLEVSAGRLGAYQEQKSAVDLEVRSIRSGRDARLSSDERSRRDGLHADLSSTDAKKRRAALEGLRALYYR